MIAKREIEVNTMSLPIEPLLEYVQAARILGIGVGTLKDWVLKRKIAFVKNGKAIAFEPDALREHIAQRRVPARVQSTLVQ